MRRNNIIRIVWWLLRFVLMTVALASLVTCALHVSHSDAVDNAPAADGAVLRVASYNVHYIILHQDKGSWSVGDWDRRKTPLDKAFKALDADIVAFQEMESWRSGGDKSVNLARDFLAEQNPEFGVAATGDWREFPTTQPIFYRKSRLQPIDQGWFFFSTTPDVIYSRTFNGSFPAFASWVQFEDLTSGQRFRVIDVHFEYKSRSNRLLSAVLVRDRMEPWIKAGETVFLVGDLNVRYGAKTMKILQESGVVFDPIPGASYHLNKGLHLFGSIDHLAHTSDVKIVDEPIVVQRKFDGEWPSDHYPIYADYLLPSEVK